MTRGILIGCVLIVACDDGSTIGQAIDVSARDAIIVFPSDSLPKPDAAPDMIVVDAAAIPDAKRPDAAVLDMAPPDMAIPDVLPPDMAPPCDPTPEICNGLDDDCDDAIDEGFLVGAPCSVGVGECRVTSQYRCTDEGQRMCPAVAGEPVDELCDGLDNNCNGRIDEIFDDDGDGAPLCASDPCVECPIANPEICRALCDAQDCNDEDGSTFPAANDVCGDGVDQNCDGLDASCTVALGRLNGLTIAEANAPLCPDVNGDGMPDNGMAFIGGLANMALNDSVAMNQLNIFIAAAGLAPPGLEGAFDLSVLTAGVADDEGYEVDPATLDANGDPLIRFPGARVREGTLRAGPGRFSLALPFGDLALELVLYNARISGAIGVDDQNGLTLRDGILWGAVTDDDLQATFDGILANCENQDPEPEFCGLLRMFRPLLANLLNVDQDLNADGVNEAYSICIQIGADPAALRGWPAED